MRQEQLPQYWFCDAMEQEQEITAAAILRRQAQSEVPKIPIETLPVCQIATAANISKAIRQRFAQSPDAGVMAGTPEGAVQRSEFLRVDRLLRSQRIRKQRSAVRQIVTSEMCRRRTRVGNFSTGAIFWRECNWVTACVGLPIDHPKYSLCSQCGANMD
jgi:hypothetical protein